MSEGEAVPAPSGSVWASPFAIFGYVMIVASVWAVFEMAYYAGVSALGAETLGTISGVIIAVIAFLVIGIEGPANE
jgi:hypothetical protein